MDIAVIVFATIGGISGAGSKMAGMGDDIVNSKNFKTVSDSYLNKNGIDNIHKFKEDILGTKNVSKFDIVKETTTGELLIIEKSTQKVVERTFYYIN